MSRIKQATPADTYEHVFGSGFEVFSWWVSMRGVNVDMRSLSAPPDNWQVTLTVETGNNSPATKSVTVDHALILKTARYVTAHLGAKRQTPGGSEYPAWSRSLEEACKDLLFDAPDLDIDAPVADELLQLAILGEVVFS